MYDPHKSLTLYFGLRSTFYIIYSPPPPHPQHSSNAAQMTSSLPWFRKGTDSGTIITLDKPLSSQWKILEKLNEPPWSKIRHMASVLSPRLSSCVVILDDLQRKQMRVYIQVPHRRTEMNDADTRGQQVTLWTPQELASLLDLTEQGSNTTPKLLGYKTCTQDHSGLVPGGFIIWLVWEIVPGLRLGDGDGAGPFWGLESYFIDRFSKAMEGEPRHLAEPAQRIATFELALPDIPVRWKDWGKDTSRWKW
ncbi:hypothetical protein PENCOP_c005G00076 [Penicillium coprophilum]|uniref:Uncharacterized protein n=1 Tax=Penicillium coprophilum TaxID=36646 RepID=A0A1V6URL2_9EURO|nr:hypothetical protein PENCOP_c005G00076 [Penicillium coprophilum]